MMARWHRWGRLNLYPSWAQGLLSAALGFGLAWLAYEVLRWGVWNASWSGDDREACLAPEQGACWAFVRAKFGQFVYGRYGLEERWRVDIVFALMAAGVLLLFSRFTAERLGRFLRALEHPRAWVWRIGLALGLFPVLGTWLLLGGFGLAPMPANLWGGLLLTLVIAISGIVASLPLGIVLALARTSQLKLLRALSIGFIEFIRGMPLIMVLFMASIMLPLFFPPGLQFDKLLNCLIGVALFAAAYMAEVVRGGLQAVPRGQYEAAHALGLNYWQTQRRVILPQALALVVPGIVNTFIGLFKDTSLVLIIGLFDLLGIVQLNFTDANWSTPSTRLSGYAFAGAVFWLFCFAMSRYSQRVERTLARSDTKRKLAV